MRIRHSFAPSYRVAQFVSYISCLSWRGSVYLVAMLPGLPVPDSLVKVTSEVIHCNLCPRLRHHCEYIAKVKRKSFENEVYWAKPLPGFGDQRARLVVIGLAPAAHGGNRTGRIFTGDRSGDWLYRALYKAGFANQALSASRDDGLQLRDAYVNAMVRCAPPENRPLPNEILNCSRYLKREFALLKRARVYVALGQMVYTHILPHLFSIKPRPTFSHGKQVRFANNKTLIMSYHPSQRNTFTGRLTESMFDQIFQAAKKIISED